MGLFIGITIPKTNSSHLKTMERPKSSSSLPTLIFEVFPLAVCFREGMTHANGDSMFFLFLAHGLRGINLLLNILVPRIVHHH